MACLNIFIRKSPEEIVPKLLFTRDGRESEYSGYFEDRVARMIRIDHSGYNVVDVGDNAVFNTWSVSRNAGSIHIDSIKRGLAGIMVILGNDVIDESNY